MLQDFEGNVRFQTADRYEEQKDGSGLVGQPQAAMHRVLPRRDCCSHDATGGRGFECQIRFSLGLTHAAPSANGLIYFVLFLGTLVLKPVFSVMAFAMASGFVLVGS